MASRLGPVVPVDLADFLSGVDAEATSDQVLDRATAFFKKRDLRTFWPRSLSEAHAALDSKDADVKRQKANLTALGTKIDRERATLDRTSEVAVASFNSLVDRHEQMRTAYNEAIDALNQDLDDWNARKIGSRTIVSIGGGISLEPESFAKPVVNPASPKIVAVRAARSRAGGSPAIDGLVSSAAMTVVPRVVPPAVGNGGAWKSAPPASSDGVIEARWTRVDASSATVIRLPGDPVVKYEVKTPTYFARTSVQPALRTAMISNSAYPAQILTVGEIAAGRTVMLRRGAPLTTSPQEPTWSR